MKLVVILVSFFAVISAERAKVVKESKDGQFTLIIDQGSPKEMNWMKAQLECMALGMHLASVHNANEANTISDLCLSTKEEGEDRTGEIHLKKVLVRYILKKY